MPKKTIYVKYARVRKTWGIELKGFDSDVLQDLIQAIREAARIHDLSIFNVTDPFGGVVKTRPVRGKRNKTLQEAPTPDFKASEVA